MMRDMKARVLITRMMVIDEIFQMSDIESEESDGIFGVDDSTKEKEDDVEVPIGKEIDNSDFFFDDAGDPNEGEEMEEGEGTMEGSHKQDEVLDSSGSDSDGGRDNETEGKKNPPQKNQKRKVIESETDNEEETKKKKNKKKKKKDEEGLGM